MAENPFHQAIYLTGPTASGKTTVGVALAKRLGAEVVALDSMTLYRGMDIGTAKPTLDERRGIPHHLIDVIDPWESASVALYRSWAERVVQDVARRGHRAVFVGGTALYLKALLRGLFEGPEADASIRQALEAEAGQFGSAALHARLATLDPISAARLHPNDVRRIVRALEVFQATGRPLSAWQTEHDQPAPSHVPVFALWRPRLELHERINQRVLAMFAQGLVEEVLGLRDATRPIHPIPAQGVGYKEVIEYLEGQGTQAETILRVQARTRQFAKRQETWFRGLEEVEPLPVGPDERPEAIADRLLARIALRSEN